MIRLLGITAALERVAIPARVKVDVVIRQKGKCSCGCNKPLSNLDETRFDHDPPLALRARNANGTNYDPSANDPRFIFAMRIRCHDRKTNHPRGPHTTIDSDRHSIAHSVQSVMRYAHLDVGETAQAVDRLPSVQNACSAKRKSSKPLQ